MVEASISEYNPLLYSPLMSSYVPRFSADCGFEKPNDSRALHLMNAVAAAVVKEIPDVIFAYGVSDEFR